MFLKKDVKKCIKEILNYYKKGFPDTKEIERLPDYTWNTISQSEIWEKKLTPDFIEQYAGRLNWSEISYTQKLPRKLIEKFKNSVNLTYLLQNPYTPLKEYKDLIPELIDIAAKKNELSFITLELLYRKKAVEDINKIINKYPVKVKEYLTYLKSSKIPYKTIIDILYRNLVPSAESTDENSYAGIGFKEYMLENRKVPNKDKTFEVLNKISDILNRFNPELFEEHKAFLSDFLYYAIKNAEKTHINKNNKKEKLKIMNTLETLDRYGIKPEKTGFFKKLKLADIKRPDGIYL